MRGDGRVTGRRVERAADSHANEGVKSIPPTQQPGGWTGRGQQAPHCTAALHKARLSGRRSGP